MSLHDSVVFGLKRIIRCYAKEKKKLTYVIIIEIRLNTISEQCKRRKVLHTVLSCLQVTAKTLSRFEQQKGQNCRVRELAYLLGIFYPTFSSHFLQVLCRKYIFIAPLLLA